MKALSCTLAVMLALAAVSLAQSANNRDAAVGSAKERLVGAWHLVSMEEPGADGKVHRIADRKGMLLYTRDGHMSVQIMFPKSEAAVSNDYVRHGYEGSFGSYEVNEAEHTVTHHVEGSITPALVGKDLTRVYQFASSRLIIKSARADEHWSVTWEHY